MKTLYKKWEHRKSLNFLSRIDTPARDEVLLEISKGIKMENKSDELIPQELTDITDDVLEAEVLLLIIKIHYAKSIALTDNESIDKLDALRDKVNQKDFDYDITMRELKRIGDHLKK